MELVCSPTKVRGGDKRGKSWAWRWEANWHKCDCNISVGLVCVVPPAWRSGGGCFSHPLLRVLSFVYAAGGWSNPEWGRLQQDFVLSRGKVSRSRHRGETGDASIHPVVLLSPNISSHAEMFKVSSLSRWISFKFHWWVCWSCWSEFFFFCEEHLTHTMPKLSISCFFFSPCQPCTDLQPTALALVSGSLLEWKMGNNHGGAFWPNRFHGCFMLRCPLVFCLARKVCNVNLNGGGFGGGVLI